MNNALTWADRAEILPIKFFLIETAKDISLTEAVYKKLNISISRTYGLLPVQLIAKTS